MSDLKSRPFLVVNFNVNSWICNLLTIVNITCCDNLRHINYLTNWKRRKMSSDSELPPELLTQPLALVGLTGLNIESNSNHSSIWNSFSSAIRSERPPLNFILFENNYVFPPAKPDVTFMITTLEIKKKMDNWPIICIMFSESFLWMVHSQRDFKAEMDEQTSRENTRCSSFILWSRVGWSILAIQAYWMCRPSAFH